MAVMTQHIVMAVMLKKTAQRRIPVAVSTVPIRYSFRSVRYLISMRQGMAMSKETQLRSRIGHEAASLEAPSSVTMET